MIKVYSFLFLILFTSIVIVSCNGQPDAKSNNTKLAEKPRKVIPYIVNDSIVRSILRDSKGNLWIGRGHAGLTKFDGKSYTHYSTKDGLSDNQIRTIQEDSEGNLWFATGNGVSQYNGQRFTVLTSQDFLSPPLKSRDQWPKVTSGLWFNGEKEGGIYWYNGRGLSVFDFPVLDPNHESFSIKGTVTGISHGKYNMLWIANYGGVIGYNGNAFSYINDRQFEYHVRSILEDSKGNLWIGNNGIGVLLYDGNSTINFTELHGVDDTAAKGGGSLSPLGTMNHIFAIAEDKQGNIWFGDRDTGAWRYDGTSLTNYTLKDGLTNTFVNEIYQDKNGDLLFGLGDGNICIFNGKTFDKM